MDELESTVASARQIHRDVEGFHDVMGEYLKLLIYVILMHFSPSEKTGRFDASLWRHCITVPVFFAGFELLPPNA